MKYIILTLIAALFTGCATYKLPSGETDFTKASYDAASVYLVTKGKLVKEKDRKTIAKAYKIFHTAIADLPAAGMPSLKLYIQKLLADKIEDEDDRALALLFFNQACEELKRRVDISGLKDKALLAAVQKIDKGIQQALLEYSFLAEKLE